MGNVRIVRESHPSGHNISFLFTIILVILVSQIANGQTHHDDPLSRSRYNELDEAKKNTDEVDVGDDDAYCLGTADPTCYFPDDPYEPGDSVVKPSSTLVGQAFENLDENQPRIRRETKPVPGPTNGTTTPPTADEEEGYDDEPISVQPLSSEAEMAEVHLKQYSPDDVVISYYPPWTYHGFYSPKEWDRIPQHYFASHSRRKKTQLGEMLKRDVKEEGRSFMELGENGTISNCTTDFPSPIDIITKNAREEIAFVEFNMMNHDVNYGFTMFIPQDGTDLLFVKLSTPLKAISKKPSIDKGNILGSPLTLDRILIHYGSVYTQGSEHRLDGKSFGMELQFMFTLQTKGKERTYYDVLYEYITNKDASAFGKNQLALCIFVEVGPPHEKEAPKGMVYNDAMSLLATAAAEFAAIKNTGKYRAFMVKKKRLRLQDFFQVPFQGHYYTYFGSLTHPPCFNNSRYSVFEKPIYIKYEMWQKFQFLPSEFSDTGFMADNFRPLESINVINNFSSPQHREILPYLNAEVRVNVSFTVVKSRFATQAERMIEYDYEEDNRKKKSLATRNLPIYSVSALNYLFVYLSFPFYLIN